MIHKIDFYFCYRTAKSGEPGRCHNTWNTWDLIFALKKISFVELFVLPAKVGVFRGSVAAVGAVDALPGAVAATRRSRTSRCCTVKASWNKKNESI